MKKNLLLSFVLLGGLAMAQTGKVGVETSNPTETFHVQGTVRIADLPMNEKANAINTTTEGTDAGSKNQPFKATKTVVVNDQGVLGVVDGVRGAKEEANDSGVEIYTPVKKCAKNQIGAGESSRTKRFHMDFPESGYRFSWFDTGAFGKAQVDVQRIAPYQNNNRHGKVTFWFPYTAGAGGSASDIEVTSTPTRVFDQSFNNSTASRTALIFGQEAQTFLIDFATINSDGVKVMNICIEQTVF